MNLNYAQCSMIHIKYLTPYLYFLITLLISLVFAIRFFLHAHFTPMTLIKIPRKSAAKEMEYLQKIY